MYVNSHSLNKSLKNTEGIKLKLINNKSKQKNHGLKHNQ